MLIIYIIYMLIAKEKLNRCRAYNVYIYKKKDVGHTIYIYIYIKDVGHTMYIYI